MEGTSQGRQGQIKAPFAGEMPLHLLLKILSSSGMGEKIIKPAFGKACSAKSDFRFTAFSEVAGYQCDSTAAWPSVGALVLGLSSRATLPGYPPSAFWPLTSSFSF